MSKDLPAFARILQQRERDRADGQATPRQVDNMQRDNEARSVERDRDYSSDFSPRRASVDDDSAKYPNSAYSIDEDGRVDSDMPPELSEPGDSEELELALEDLTQQVEMLRDEKKSLSRQLGDLKRDTGTADDLSRALEESDREVDELRQILESREMSLTALDDDYRRLANDCKRITDLHNADAKNLALKQREIEQLQAEIDNCHPGDQTSRYAPARNNVMHDNLLDGLSVESAFVSDAPVDRMTDGEIGVRLKQMLTVKEEKEREMNRVPPKGANMSHVRRVRGELQDEIDDIGKTIVKIRVEMKKRGLT